ncbi:TonB-dependent receptor plug domain-containing protein [Glaesserella sp.]|uniref:TonB-dependent receptor plug domain-containing protein n=1 Tax=Glaesserella sp. TaxID=2094731 RepID=UPI0035A115E9
MKRNLVTTLVLTLPSFAIAQTEQATELPPLNVYSAYAAPVNQDKTASSVTVLTEKDFTERNATYVSDVLKTVPSVAIGSNGGRGAVTSLFLRGANSNHTAIIIDGVKVNPIDTNFSFGGLSLSNIERIEVLRGEQSALWGSEAVGGVVYITTKSGLYKDKPFNVDFDFGLGSHNTRDASATVSGYDNGFYYALHGDSHRTRGISVASKDTFRYTANDGSRIVTGGATEKDGFHRDNASLRLGYDDSKKGVELLASHYSQSFQNDDLKSGNVGQVYTSYENLAYYAMRDRETVFKLGGYWGSDQDLFKHKASVSHLKHDTDVFGLYAGTKDWKKLNANYQLDINFDREGSLTQALSLLADYQRTSFISNNFENGEKRLSEKSLATEYRLFTEDDHSLSLSGRFTDNKLYPNVWTGRISGAYRLSPNFKTHASFGSAIKNPTVTDYFGWNPSYYVGNPNLKPEKSLGGDLGVLIETADKAHSLDVTYFARNVNNFIAMDEKCYCQSINLDGTTKVKGVELAYTGKFTDNLTGYANYTYTNTRDSKGKELVRRPKHSANASLAYQITDKLGSSVSVSYVGKRTDNYWDANYVSHTVKMSSYTLVNLGTNYQITKNVNIYANLNNLFDKKYENIIGYGQDGRNVYVGLKGSF